MNESMAKTERPLPNTIVKVFLMGANRTDKYHGVFCKDQASGNK